MVRAAPCNGDRSSVVRVVQILLERDCWVGVPKIIVAQELALLGY